MKLKRKLRQRRKREPSLGERKRRKRKKSSSRKEFTLSRWERHGLDPGRRELLALCGLLKTL